MIGLVTRAIDVKMDGPVLEKKSSFKMPYGHVWNTVVMSGLVLLVSAWNS